MASVSKHLSSQNKDSEGIEKKAREGRGRRGGGGGGGGYFSINQSILHHNPPAKVPMSGTLCEVKVVASCIQGAANTYQKVMISKAYLIVHYVRCVLIWGPGDDSRLPRFTDGGVLKVQVIEV